MKPEEREIDVRLSYNYIGYLVTDLGKSAGKNISHPIRVKGHIQLVEGSMKFREVNPKKLERFISLVSMREIGKDLLNLL